ncbi:MAG: hypothetical protein WC071_00445 [Victivallaceae bacterium]
MKIWVKNLLELQEVDMRIKDMKSRISLLPKEKTALKEKLEAAKTELSGQKDAFRKAELEIKRVEGSINQLNDSISKLNQQSSLVKKNNEYQAMMQEIATNKEKISAFESEEIELLDTLEELKEQFKANEKQFEARTASVKEELQELEQLEKELHDEIAAITGSRQQFESKIEASLLSLYNRLLKSTGAPLVKINKENCGNCHLKLTPQIMTEAKRGAITNCNNCSHLIYIEEA